MKTIIICVIAAGLLSVAASYPSSYAFDFIASQANGCAVRLENPVARTGLGLVGNLVSLSGWGVGLVVYLVEMSVPSTAKVFHGPRCQ